MCLVDQLCLSILKEWLCAERRRGSVTPVGFSNMNPSCNLNHLPQDPLCGLDAPSCCGWIVMGADSLLCRTVPWSSFMWGLACDSHGILTTGARPWLHYLRDLAVTLMGPLGCGVNSWYSWVQAWLWLPKHTGGQDRLPVGLAMRSGCNWCRCFHVVGWTPGTGLFRKGSAAGWGHLLGVIGW